MVERPNLKFLNFKPGLPEELALEPNIFKAMSRGDILIHTPYQSFDPVLELTKQAVEDPDVVAIKMTVYRTGSDSELAQNLIKAAQLGKQVVASVELFARFDEEANVELANNLENAGAHVVYGVMGYKVHAKMLLVIRRENGHLKHYVHLGTGNYHQRTAKVYTDFGLLTTRDKITQDVNNLFAQITGIGKAAMLKTIYQSPFTLHELVIRSIETEITHAINGRAAIIYAKMNSLLEPQVIQSLYRASQAGVKITLIIRGACALIPGIPGLSDNIEVRSIVGRFLEHHRAFYFYNCGAHDVYISSADWMKRNFFRRVETCIPILDHKVKRRIISEGFKLYLQDNVESWVMDQFGNYSKYKRPGRRVSAQKTLIKQLGSIEDINY
jgi:polyphosphate kinase